MGTTDELLIPPVNFAMVDKGVYRSGYPNKKNLPFLHKLRLRSVMYVSTQFLVNIASLWSFGQLAGSRLQPEYFSLNCYSCGLFGWDVTLKQGRCTVRRRMDSGSQVFSNPLYWLLNWNCSEDM